MNGLAVVVQNESEYKRLQEFLSKDVLYIDWAPQMGEIETGVVLWSNHPDFSAGSVGHTGYQASYGFRHVEFKDWFKNE